MWGEKNIDKLPFHTDISGVILYHHENADGSGPFGKKWDEIPLFSRIIHLCDLLDVASSSQSFTGNPWDTGAQFVQKMTGSLFDRECAAAFFAAFSKERFLSMGGADFAAHMWQKTPRIKQELTFAQIKAIADFFAQIVDYKSPFISTRSLGVAEDAEKLARYMGFDEQTAQKMYLAGALHDIGKVAIGNKIFEKLGRLTDGEFKTMKHHAAYICYILSEIDDFAEIRDWAAFHHERLDGTGYPFGKTAAELSTQERIMACVDSYQALTESRPYKQGMPHEKAIGILQDIAQKGWIDARIVAKTDECFR